MHASTRASRLLRARAGTQDDLAHLVEASSGARDGADGALDRSALSGGRQRASGENRGSLATPRALRRAPLECWEVVDDWCWLRGVRTVGVAHVEGRRGVRVRLGQGFKVDCHVVMREARSSLSLLPLLSLSSSLLKRSLLMLNRLPLALGCSWLSRDFSTSYAPMEEDKRGIDWDPGDRDVGKRGELFQRGVLDLRHRGALERKADPEARAMDDGTAARLNRGRELTRKVLDRRLRDSLRDC